VDEKRRGGKGGTAPWRSGRRERQGADQDSSCELDLELVIAGRFGVGECRRRRASEGIRVAPLPASIPRSRIADVWQHAASAEPCLVDRACRSQRPLRPNTRQA